LSAANFRLPSSLVTEQGLSEATTEPLAPPLWLSELNQWRRMAGLRVVAENAHLSDGSEAHARYLIAQGPEDIAGFRAYDRNIGPGAHLEDSRVASYTPAGAEAAMGGPLAAHIIQGADVAWEGRSESDDIDALILAPFHRLSLLAPWAQIGGYGSSGAYPRRAAALALRGQLETQQHPDPVEFPPANASISVNAWSAAEWPDPIAGCAGYQRPVGLPITLQLGRRLLLQSYSLHEQSTARALEACGFDAASYRNSNATQQKRGRELLNAYGALVLIPRKPLSSGHEYRVTVQTSQGRFEWGFGPNDAPNVKPARVRRAATKQVLAAEVISRTALRASAKVSVGNGAVWWRWR
jgi:hypothetical protein